MSKLSEISSFALKNENINIAYLIALSLIFTNISLTKQKIIPLGVAKEKLVLICLNQS